MSDRRGSERPESPDRRTFPRPPLWLNILLLLIAAGTFLYAKHHRDQIRAQTAKAFQGGSPSAPVELDKMREELASMDLTREQLAKELDGRMSYLQALESEKFYIAIDTKTKKMHFRLGKAVIREADVQLGEEKIITAGEKTWRFPTLKGGFSVLEKESGGNWQIPEWVYVMNNQPLPAERPTIDAGLGKYVIFLPNNYVIHSPPAPDSPLKGAKPGSFMVPEEDLAAIWPRISTATRVYIF